MTNLKSICFLLVIFYIFTGCSSAQDKKSPSASSTPILIGKAKKFESKEGNFTINLFEEPSAVRNLGTDASEKKGIDVGKQYIWKFEKTLYTAMYSNPFDSNGNAMPQIFDEMLSGSRKGIARQGGKLISEKEISYGKYTGREFRYLASNGVKFVGRNYLIDKVGYQIVGAYADDKDEKEVLEILDSFKVMTEKN